MPSTTTNQQIPYPIASDKVYQGPTHFRQLAERVDTLITSLTTRVSRVEKSPTTTSPSTDNVSVVRLNENGANNSFAVKSNRVVTISITSADLPRSGRIGELLTAWNPPDQVIAPIWMDIGSDDPPQVVGQIKIYGRDVTVACPGPGMRYYANVSYIV